MTYLGESKILDAGNVAATGAQGVTERHLVIKRVVGLCLAGLNVLSPGEAVV
jgi:hypothetical protein